MSAREAEWPKHGPDFNRWNGDLVRLAQLLSDPSNSGFWVEDMPLKYLEIRVDTRDGGFLLFDGDRNPVQPERVVAAIEKWGGMGYRAIASGGKP